MPTKSVLVVTISTLFDGGYVCLSVAELAHIPGLSVGRGVRLLVHRHQPPQRRLRWSQRK